MADKPPLIIIARDERIGDAVEAWPCIHALADEFRDVSDIYIAPTNREVAKIMLWPEGAKDILEIEPPFNYSGADAFVLGAGAALGYKFSPSVLHISQMFYLRCGLEPPDTVPQPTLNVPPSVAPLDFDYLIAPWSLDEPRGLTDQEAAALINELKQRGRVGVLGASGDRRPFDDVEYLYGFRLGAVVNMLRDCRGAVITTDSAISRLAHAAEIPNHCLLFKPLVVPIQWASHPKCVVVSAIPDNFFGNFRTQDVMLGVEQAVRFKDYALSTHVAPAS